jgi:glycosyltransferase involved in cell wall biosynthesis
MVRRALVVTVVHHPLDSRIYHRQIGALLRAGWRVTYVAPFSGYEVAEDAAARPGLTTVDVTRARGRRRVGAVRHARSLLHRLGDGHDVVLLHDPELVLVASGRRLPPVVWDVHEDTAAAVQVRSWVPDQVRGPLGWAVRRAERWAENRYTLFLADEDYRHRFARAHVVVPNLTSVPPEPGPRPARADGRFRVLYVGSITMERGAADMIEVARRLPENLRLELVGPAHAPAATLVRQAVEDGVLDWHGFVPGDRVPDLLRGALAGLCLLHDEANFRPSMATKVIEYLAHAVPAVVTPLPAPRALVERSGGGVTVPFGDVDAVVRTLTAWAEDPERARALGVSGHAYVLEHHDWNRAQHDFVAELEAAASSRS